MRYNVDRFSGTPSEIPRHSIRFSSLVPPITDMSTRGIDVDRSLAPEGIFKTRNKRPCQLPALFDLPLPPSPSPAAAAAAVAAAAAAASPPLPWSSSRAFVSPLSFSRACETPVRARKLYLYPPAAAVARLSLSRAQRPERTVSDTTTGEQRRCI